MELLEVANDALIWSTQFDLLLSAALGATFGFFGSFIAWLALVVAYPITLTVPFGLPLFFMVGAGTLGLSLLAISRNQLLRKIARRGFVFTFRFQQYTNILAYDIALFFGVYAILSLYKVVPTYSIAFSVLLAGLFFFLGAPRFIFSRLLKENWEARLSILQFLVEKQASENPRFWWLRRGMRGVEQRLRYSGLSVSPGILFHGVSYSLFREILPDIDIQFLAEYLIHPLRYQQVNSIIAGLVWESNQATKDGLGRIVGMWELLVRLPWQNVKVAIGILVPLIGAIIGVLPAIINLLNSIHP